MKKVDLAIFAIWFVIISVPIASMMANHSFSFTPTHSKNLRQLASQNKITVLHFLGTDCDCSKAVFKKLMQRYPRNDVEEKIFIIGKGTNWKKQLEHHHYQNVMQNEMSYFEKLYDIKAVPQLSIINGEKLLYSGGYTKNRSSRDQIEEQEIIDGVVHFKIVETRPIYGCINGSENRKLIDPLNLKYSR